MNNPLDDHLQEEIQRQDVLSLKKALRDRETELQKAEELRQLVEDDLEDSHKEIDKLKQQLDEAEIKADEAVFDLNEIETAKTRLSSKLYALQEEIDLNEVSVFKDERVQISKPVQIDVDGKISSNRFFTGFLSGILFTLVLCVALLFVTKGDDLIAKINEILYLNDITLPSLRIEKPQIRRNQLNNE